LGCNAAHSVDYLKSILHPVGVEREDDKIELLLIEIKDTNFAELIASGRGKYFNFQLKP